LTPEAFRRDPWLRTSASHLATWSVAAVAVELLLRASPRISATTVATVVAVAVAAIVASMTTERRIAKMAGPAHEPIDPSAAPRFGLAIALLVTASLALVAASRADALPMLWLLGTGNSLVVWGSKLRFAWYVRFGVALVGAGVLEAVLAASGERVIALHLIVMGIGVPVAAIVTNRRWLWIRER
jgi:hypothetical protein